MRELSARQLISSAQVDPSWGPVLEAVSEPLSEVGLFLEQEILNGFDIAPETQNLFRALTMPQDHVRVLILGQDPYPTAGHATGLAFSVTESARPFPPSLRNIFAELCADLGCAKPASGDLTTWADQGVLLLNRVLSTRVGMAGAHRRKGWEFVTEQIVQSIDSSDLVAILWGQDAQTARPLLPLAHVIESAHPSPLSARRGFFGSRPFSATNSFFERRGLATINWELLSEPELM